MPAEHVYVPNMTPLMTAEDLLKPGVPERADLVRGVLGIPESPGFLPREITVRLTIALGTYVVTSHLGRVVAGDAGFKLQSDPGTVRGADIAFVSWERMPQESPVGFPPLGPDLVVEVLSPGDRPGETLAKIADWLSAGTRLAWVLHPERRLARRYRRGGTQSIAGHADDCH